MTLAWKREKHALSAQTKIEKVLRLTTCSCRIGPPFKNKSWNIVLKLARIPRANRSFIAGPVITRREIVSLQARVVSDHQNARDLRERRRHHRRFLRTKVS